MDMAKDESGNYKVDEVKKADASVKTMADFTSPDILIQRIDRQRKEIPSFHGHFHDRKGLSYC